VRKRRSFSSVADFRAFLRRRFTREGAIGLYMTIGFLASGLLLVLFSILLDEVFEISTPGALDRAVTLSVARLRTPWLDVVFRRLTDLGDFRFLTPATLLVSGALALRGRRVSGLLFAGSVLGGFLLETLVKMTFHRNRPDLWPALVTEKTFSFPSGHATMSTLFFAGTAAVVFHVDRRFAPRAAAVAGAAAVIGAVAFSRIYLGAHWLTDVAAGILLGLFWVVLCATGTEYFARRG
jgi:undecaprenyl-diphosphatase